jgi:hypothetical protein
MSFVRKLADGELWRRGDAGPDDPAAAPGPGRAGQLMRFARALVGELVHKKLWPVALLLCAAIIAIPVLMTRGAGSDDAAAAPATLPQGDIAAANVFEPIGPPAAAKARPGGQLDPFRQPAKKASAKPRSMPLGGATSSLGTASGTSAGGTSSGNPSAGGTPSGGTPSGTAPPAAADRYYRTAVR